MAETHLSLEEPIGELAPFAKVEEAVIDEENGPPLPFPLIDEEIGPPLPLSLTKALELDEGLPLLPLLP